MFVRKGEHLQENDYVFEEIKPQVLSHLTNHESDFKSRFWDLYLFQYE
jgi:hypothetical protein